MRTGGEQHDDPPVTDMGGPAAGSARWWWVGLAVIVLGALALRLWGIRWGLPFAYSLDERSHFVPRAVEMFRSGSLDPDYQLNPAGLIEWVAAALLVTHGSSHDVVHNWTHDPASVWTTARVASALLSTAAVALLYAAGARLFDRRVGLLAAAILATAFLPVNYGHLALNDAPSLAPTALALFAVAGIVRRGRRRDYLLAGAALGFAVGFKYNAAFVVLPLGAAATIHALGWRPGDLRRGADAGASGLEVAGPRAGTTERPTAGRDGAAREPDGAAAPAADGSGTGRRSFLPAWRPALLGLVLAAVAAIVAFFLCDPYAILRPGFLRSELAHLSSYTSGGLLLGETDRSGYHYYAKTLVWGFGVLPLILVLVGVARTALRDRWQALVLVPAPVLFLIVIGSQGRYFARYAMPIYPLLAVLAAAGGVWALDLMLRRLRAGRGLRLALGLVLGLLVVGQGLVFAVHNDVVLARKDTRTLTREWLVDHVPANTKILVEPLVPKEWYADGARLPDPKSHQGYRWARFVRSGKDKRRLAKEFPGAKRSADFANYGFTLFPGLIDYYRQQGVCWIVSGSGQSGRVFNNPDRVPQAVRYYHRLERDSDLRFSVAPFPGPEAKNDFQYDLSFDFAPLKYVRPGPSMRVYRLRDCRPRSEKP